MGVSSLIPSSVPLMRQVLIPAALALLVVPSTTAAQVRPGSRDTVPTSMLPPAGKCRIWITGVAPAQQPAATDCPTALRQRSANSVILYGPPLKSAGSGRFDPAVGREEKEAPEAPRAPRIAPPNTTREATTRDATARDAVPRKRVPTEPVVKPVPLATPAVRAEKPPVKSPPTDPPKKKPELP
jgi:hypothetical protein